jgi:hypothetical protein
MKNVILWDAMPYGSYKNRRFGGTWCAHHQVDNRELGTTLGNLVFHTNGSFHTLVFLRSVGRLLVTADVIPSSQSPVTLMMEALGSSETSVRTRVIRSNIRENGIFHMNTFY